MIFVHYNCELMNRADLYQRFRRLAETGVTMKEAQERLGYSSITQTMDTYTHLTEKTKKETIQKTSKIC